MKINPETQVIEEAKFKTFGCGSAIASSSLATEWVKGKTVEEALAIKNTDIVRELSPAAGEDPLLGAGRGRHQGGHRRLEEEGTAPTRRNRRLRPPRRRRNNSAQEKCAGPPSMARRAFGHG